MTIRTAIGIFLAVAASFAQTPDGLPKFDSISIRTAGPSAAGQQMGSSGSAEQGQIIYYRRSLVSLLPQFYGVAIDQIVVPEAMHEWMYDTKPAGAFTYNISVTMPRGTSEQQLQLMMQNLLADRFHLRLHRETRNFQSYELIVAEGGPKMGAVDVGPKGGNTSGMQGVIRHRANGETMAEFASLLGTMINESRAEVLGVSTPRVVDKTGLTGRYGFALAFTGWWILPGRPLSQLQKINADPDAANLPDIFGALETQLGLKLVRVADLPLDVLIIDHADPAADGN